MEVSIIIPASAIALPDYHLVLAECLESVRANAGYDNYEILIVDNVMHGQAARAFLRSAKRQGCRVLPYPFKFHRSRISNFAARHARGDFLLFLDSDALPGPNFLASLVGAARSCEGVEAVGARIVDAARTSRQVCGFKRAKDAFVPADAADLSPGQVADREGLSLCCLLIGKKTFDRLGGFDERYRFYNADIDLCQRIRLSGGRCVLAADAFVLHRGGLTRGIFRSNRYPKVQDDRILRRTWIGNDAEATPPEMLVVKLLTLGDAVMVTPALKAIRETRPGARITLVTCRDWKEVFEGNPFVDEVIAVERPPSRVAPGYLFYDSVTHAFLQKKQWAEVIEFNCLDFLPQYRRTGLHFRDFYAEMAGVYPLRDTKYFIAVGEKDRRAAQEVLSACRPGPKTICVHTNAGWALKNWPRTKWLEFAAQIRRTFGARVVQVGLPEERIDSPDMIDLCGTLGLKELAALFETADLFVGLDSGLMHLASAVGAPVVALFGPTHARVALPNCDNYVAVQAPASCEVPCGLTACVRGVECMQSIRVETVVRAATRLLERKGPVREEWKGDEPAHTFFTDWEWHTRPAGAAVHAKGGWGEPQRPAAGAASSSVPVRRTKRILFQARGNLFALPGGDTEVLLNLERRLGDLGFAIAFSSDPNAPLADADLVHVLNFDTPFALNAARRRVPYVVTPMYEDINRYLVKSMAACAFFLEESLNGRAAGLDPGEFLRGLEGGAAPPDFRFVAGAACAVFASGASEAERIRAHFPETRRVEIARVGFNVPTDSEGASGRRFREEYGVENFVLCVGRLESRKNQLMLLYALRNEDVPLVFVNSETVQPDYEELCRNFRRKGPTVFTGRLSRAMLFSAYEAAAVHALPSWYELPGLATLEAAWFGCRVVASRWGTVEEYLGPNAFYCEPDDPAGIRDAVCRALVAAPDPALRRRVEKYSWEREAENIAAVYDAVLAEARSRKGRRRICADAKAAEAEAAYRALRERAYHLAARQPLRALEIVESCGARGEGDPTMQIAAGLSHLALMRYAEAERYLREALDRQPWCDLRCRLFLALACMKQGKDDQAATVLKEALVVHPFADDKGRALAFGYLAEALTRCGLPAEAARAREQAERLSAWFARRGQGTAAHV